MFHSRSLQKYGKHHLTIELSPLAESDSTVLLDNLLTKKRLPDSLRREILEKTEGNAFFLEEVVRQLLRSGTPHMDGNGGGDFGGAVGISIPDTLRGVIMARIDGLSAQDRRTLQTASVLGRSFQQPVLERTIGTNLNTSDVARSLGELERRDFIHTIPADMSNNRGSGHPVECAFTHSLTHQVAHDSLLLAQRRTLHKRAAQAIEALHPGQLEDLAGTLSIHYEIADVRDRAIHFLTIAAQNAKRVFAHEEAINHYLRALKLAKDAKVKPSTMLALQEGLADVYSLTARYTSALKHYQAAGKHTRRPLIRSILLRKRGLVNEKSGLYDEAVLCYEEALKNLRNEMDDAEAARIFNGLGRVYYRQGKLDSAIELSTLALELMEGQNDAWGVAHACNNLGVVYSKSGEPAKSLEYHRRALAIWEEHGETHGLAASHNNMGWVYHQLGEFQRAIDHYQKSITLCENSGDQHGLASAYDNLSQVYARQGKQKEATAYLQNAVKILADIGAEGQEVVPDLWQQSGTW